MPPYPGFAQFHKPYSQVTEWSCKEIKGHRCIIVPVLMGTLLNPWASRRILFTEALFCVKNLVYFHLMAQYRYHTEALFKYMENHLEEFHRHVDVFWQFRASKCTKNVLESFEKQLTFDKQEKWATDPAWNNLSAAAKHCCVGDDKMRVASEIAPHLVEESDFHFPKMHLLNHFSDHIRQLSNLSNATLNSQKEQWWILNWYTDNWNIIMLPSRCCERKLRRRCFSFKSWMQMLQNDVVMMKLF